MKFLCSLLAFNCYCVIIVTSQASSRCTTPNDEEAACVSLFDCPLLLNASSKQDPFSKIFVMASACGEDKFAVCCGTSPTFTKIPSNLPPSVLSKLPSLVPPSVLSNITKVLSSLAPTENKDFENLSKEAKKKYVIEKLLPTDTYCGLQHTDDYFYNSTETSVDEFPWMVLIPTKVLAAGVIPGTGLSVGMLISDRYILTDKKVPWGIALLGLHHIYKDISCIGTPFGIDDCTSNSLIEIVEEVISSEESNFQLLRLARKISYNDYIRPICMPVGNFENPKPGDDVVTSGWGEEEISESKDITVKKRIKHTLIIQRECELGNPVSNPICAVTFQNSSRYVCPGDNGGPMMYRSTEKNRNWIALGMITGTTTCIKYQPVVAQRITPNILDWLLNKIRP